MTLEEFTAKNKGKKKNTISPGLYCRFSKNTLLREALPCLPKGCDQPPLTCSTSTNTSLTLDILLG